jgi:hypothetical protein
MIRDALKNVGKDKGVALGYGVLSPSGSNGREALVA